MSVALPSLGRWSFVLIAASLSACGSLDRASSRIVAWVSPYKLDVVQGNFVSREQLAAVKPGMSPVQVKGILGTPLLTDIFHAERWDYVFSIQRKGMTEQSRKVTVYFKDGVVARTEADELPTEAEFVASLDSGRSTRQAPVLEMSPQALEALPKPAAVPSLPAPVAAPAAAAYPPLESPAN